MRLFFKKMKILYEGLFHRNEYSQYLLAEKFVNLIYPKYKFSEFGSIYFEDKCFIKKYEFLDGKNNYHSLDRKYVLNELLNLILDVDGDTVECGVFRGSSSYLIVEFIIKNNLNKIHHMFDSFEGLSKPNKIDGNYWREGDFSRSDLYNFVFQRFKKFGSKSILYKGWIPNKFSVIENKKFSFVHIDVDLYQPTYDSLFFFYNRCNEGAIILFDDYGFLSCIGAKKAIDDFFQDKPEKIIKLNTGQAFIIKK